MPSCCDQGQFYIIFFQGPVRCMTHCPSLVIESRLLVLNLMHKLLKVVVLDLSVSGRVEENLGKIHGCLLEHTAFPVSVGADTPHKLCIASSL